MKMLRMIVLVVGLLIVLSTSGNAALVGYWNFNEGVGNVAHDQSAYSNTGNIQNATWTTGKYIYGLNFLNNNDSQVLIPNSDSLNIPNQITIMAWVKFDTINGAILAKSNQEVVNYYLKIYDYDSRLYVRFAGLAGGNMYGEFWSNSQLTSSEWTHVAVTYDGSSVNFYINGNLDVSYPASGIIETNTNPVTIGHNLDHSEQGFNGDIDEVRIYNHALNQKEIITDMNYNPPIGQPPVAEAGENILSRASEEIVLNGSKSYDSDGQIMQYMWYRPADGHIYCKGKNPTCTIKVMGLAEEVVELYVQDNDGNTAVDSMEIINSLFIRVMNN